MSSMRSQQKQQRWRPTAKFFRTTTFFRASVVQCAPEPTASPESPDRYHAPAICDKLGLLVSNVIARSYVALLVHDHTASNPAIEMIPDFFGRFGPRLQ